MMRRPDAQVRGHDAACGACSTDHEAGGECCCDADSLVQDAEDLDQLASEAAELPSVEPGELLEVGATFDRRRDEDPAGVAGVGTALDQAVLCSSTDELACRVKADVELLGDLGQ